MQLQMTAAPPGEFIFEDNDAQYEVVAFGVDEHLRGYVVILNEGWPDVVGAGGRVFRAEKK